MSCILTDPPKYQKGRNSMKHLLASVVTFCLLTTIGNAQDGVLHITLKDGRWAEGYLLQLTDSTMIIQQNIDLLEDEPATVEERFAETDKIKNQWGTRFIMLPNPTYGEWEGAVYQGNWGAAPDEKDRMRKSYLDKWEYEVPE